MFDGTVLTEASIAHYGHVECVFPQVTHRTV